jgi:hypothetical protein
MQSGRPALGLDRLGVTGPTDATGLRPQTTTLAPVVLLLGVATYLRLVQINTEEFQLVLAMNRIRRAI